MKKLLISVSFILASFATQASTIIVDQQDIINTLNLSPKQSLQLNEDLLKMSEEEQKHLTVCTSIGGGAIATIEKVVCTTPENIKYNISFKGFGPSFYVKMGLMYVTCKHPLRTGTFKAWEMGLNTGLGSFSMHFKNDESSFKIKGATLGVGMAVSLGHATVEEAI